MLYVITLVLFFFAIYLAVKDSTCILMFSFVKRYKVILTIFTKILVTIPLAIS